MKREQQRIAIAEACGWRNLWETDYHEWRGDNPFGLGDEVLPDYLNDLNAMHEAEKVLKDLNLYRKFLYLVILEDPSNISNEPAWATAAQRAEAFLTTVELWVDDLDIENLERVLAMQNECYFQSYIGTDKEDLDVTAERLEEIFAHQPDKSLMTPKEYIATLKECENALREM
jgi:hypothetical protein